MEKCQKCGEEHDQEELIPFLLDSSILFCEDCNQEELEETDMEGFIL
jgi:hypothetical protein